LNVRELLTPEHVHRMMDALAALDDLTKAPPFVWVSEVVVDASGDSFANTVDNGEDFAALFGHPALRHVTRLVLDWMMGGTMVDLSPLAKRRDLGRLTELSVSSGAPDEDARVDGLALWPSPALPNLRRLTFRGPFDESDYLPLARSHHLTRLRSLSVYFDHDHREANGDEVLAAFAESAYFPELQELSPGGVRDDRFTYRPGSVLALLKSPRLTSLEVVQFDFANAAADAWEAWEAEYPDDLAADATGFVRELTAIATACTRGDRLRRVGCGIDLLLLSPGLGPVRDQYGSRAPAPLPADLSHTGLGDAVLAALAASPHLARLIHPDGEATKPKKSAAKKKPPARPVTLNLSHNAFGDAGALALADSPQAEGLYRLDVSGNRLSPAALARLHERFPEVVFDEPR
jgi:hypothetical protein